MALAFIPSDAIVLAVQAGVVAAPRRPPTIPWIQRMSGPAWALSATCPPQCYRQCLGKFALPTTK